MENKVLNRVCLLWKVNPEKEKNSMKYVMYGASKGTW